MKKCRLKSDHSLEVEIKGKSFRAVQVRLLDSPLRTWFSMPVGLFDVLFEPIAEPLVEDELARVATCDWALAHSGDAIDIEMKLLNRAIAELRRLRRDHELCEGLREILKSCTSDPAALASMGGSASMGLNYKIGFDFSTPHDAHVFRCLLKSLMRRPERAGA